MGIRMGLLTILCFLLIGCNQSPSLPLLLDIKTPLDEAAYRVNLLRVEGNVSNPDASIKVNTSAAEILEDGSFNAWVELEKGINTLDISATYGKEKTTKTLVVTFMPPLAVAVTRLPSVSASDTPTGTINVTGAVSDARAEVSVNGIGADVGDDGHFSAQIPVPIQFVEAVATLDGEVDSDGFEYIQQTPPTPMGPWIYFQMLTTSNPLSIKPDQLKKFDVMLKTQKADGSIGPYQYEFQVTMPAGLEVAIKPSVLNAYPNCTYIITLIVKADKSLAPGNYFIGIQNYFTPKISTPGMTIKVTQ